MTKKEALHKVFHRSPALVRVLEMHRDGYTCAEKAVERNCQVQTVKNQSGSILKLFGVATMDEAARQAMWFGIIETRAPQEVEVNELWSEELQHYHRKYIATLSRTQKKEMGIVDLS